MRQITWDEFRTKAADKVPLSKLADSDGGAVYFEHDETLLALVMEKPIIYIEWAIGSGMDWARRLKKACLACGFTHAQFRTTQQNAFVNAMARYGKAEKVGEKNGDIIYRLDWRRR